MIENHPHAPCCALGDIARIFVGFSPYGRSPAGKGNHAVGMVTIKNIIDGLVQVADIDTATVENPQKLAAYRLEPEDVLISARGSIFRSGICGEGVAGLVAGSNTVVIRLNADAPIGAGLLVALLNTPKGEALLSSRAEGVAIQSLKIKTLQELHLTIPNKGQAQKLEELCRTQVALRRASLAALTSHQNIVNGLIEPLLPPV